MIGKSCPPTTKMLHYVQTDVYCMEKEDSASTAFTPTPETKSFIDLYKQYLKMY